MGTHHAPYSDRKYTCIKKNNFLESQQVQEPTAKAFWTFCMSALLKWLTNTQNDPGSLLWTWASAVEHSAAPP